MQPSLEQVERLLSQGNVIPVYRSVIADFLTPVSAFLKLKKNRPYAFLLESVEGGEKLGRYSFLGCDPFLVYRCRNGEPSGFLDLLRGAMGRFRSVQVADLPPFAGGAVGYFGYDMLRTVEQIPNTCIDDLGMDDALLMFFKTVLAFDHVRHQIHIISNLLVDESKHPVKVQYQQAVDEIRRVESILLAPTKSSAPAVSNGNVTVRSNFDKHDYLQAVKQAKEHIYAGNIFQVVLSQRSEVDLPPPPFDVYRALRVVNPSPYMFFLKMPEARDRACPGQQASLRKSFGIFTSRFQFSGSASGIRRSARCSAPKSLLHPI